jgi:transposase
MAGSCCGKPVAKIIKVADFEAGLVGLDQALRNVYISGVNSEEDIKQELLRLIKDFGNYVSSSREDDYKQALLREYRNYVANLQRESFEKNAETQKR